VEGEEGSEDESGGRGYGLEGIHGLRGLERHGSCGESCCCSLGWGSVHCIVTGVLMDIPSDSVLA